MAAQLAGAAIFDSLLDGVIVGDAATGRIVLWNPAAEALFGYSAAEAVNLRIDDLVPEDLRERCRAGLARYARREGPVPLDPQRVLVLPALRKGGDAFIAEMAFSPLLGADNRALVVALVRDVTDRRRREQRLEELSRTDGLTGVANRRQFDELLDEEWRRAARDGSSVALLMIDIDHFKDYNDVLGHQSGDECLRRVAGCLSSGARRAGEAVARYGGEEFAVLLKSATVADAYGRAEALRASIEQLRIPHPTGRPAEFVTISAGVAVAQPAVRSSPSSLVAAADGALYEAKRRGRNRVFAALPISSGRPVGGAPASPQLDPERPQP